MENILVKVKKNTSSITTEDARRLSENVEARDEKSARIISAVKSFAMTNKALHEPNTSLGQAPYTSLLTLVEDLHVAVDTNPGDVTTEVLRAAQSVISKMQRALRSASSPHPGREAELEEEIAEIEPKVTQGIVTKAEADHLHSLEARAHGHTEKGGITAIAQSVAAKRERQMSLSSNSSPNSGRSRANSKTFPCTPQEQSHYDREANFCRAEVTVKPKMEQGTLTQGDADLLYSREMRAHGHIEKGGLAAAAQSLISKKRQESLSDRSNVSPRASETDYERRKEQSYHDKENNLKVAELAIEPKTDEENASQEETTYVQPCEHHAHSHADKDGVTAEALSKVHKRENSQPVAESSR
ncbi:Nn.00g055070.m01.CDS01 [Neocucurbitaria sp. VM-36]